MAMSIGIDYAAENWKTCLMENGQTLELCSFVDSAALLAYLEHTCALYPELPIALSSALRTIWVPLNSMTDQQLGEEPPWYSNGAQMRDLSVFLIAANSINLSTYCLPGIKQLPSIAVHRKLNRREMGAANKLCIIALLLYRLCEREAAWSEMNFLCLEVQPDSMSILVVEDGQIVNGVRRHVGTGGGWEGLTHELAGLLAIHHFEDIVVMGQHKNTIIEWFDDMYQLYHFPYKKSDQEGFEAAIGAAIIAEGLGHPGLAAEVVERLQIRSAISSDVNAPVLPETQVPSLQLPR